MCVSLSCLLSTYHHSPSPPPQGKEAIKTGKLEEAHTRYTAAKKASTDVAANDELLSQIESLRSSLDDAQQNRIKDGVLDLIEDARRELG